MASIGKAQAAWITLWFQRSGKTSRVISKLPSMLMEPGFLAIIRWTTHARTFLTSLECCGLGRRFKIRHCPLWVCIQRPLDVVQWSASHCSYRLWLKCYGLLDRLEGLQLPELEIHGKLWYDIFNIYFSAEGSGNDSSEQIDWGKDAQWHLGNCSWFHDRLAGAGECFLCGRLLHHHESRRLGLRLRTHLQSRRQILEFYYPIRPADFWLNGWILLLVPNQIWTLISIQYHFYSNY